MSAAGLFAASILIVVGLINAVPVVGIASADQLARLYGIAPQAGDLLVLLRHRALLFGLLGGFLIAAAFSRAWEAPAIAMGLASMTGFIVLAWLEGSMGEPLRRVVLADAIGIAGLLAVCVIRFAGFAATPR